MLKSRLKFQLQVNSKFTSGDIFSQVAVSLFALPSCSLINFLPRIITPSVRLRDCTIGHTLEKTPGALRGCQSLCLLQPPTCIQFKTPDCIHALGISAIWVLLTWDPFPSRAFSPPCSRRVAWGSPNSTALSLRDEHFVFS